MNSLHTSEAARYRIAARAYCAHVDARRAIVPEAWLRHMHTLLAELYAAALALPVVQSDAHEWPPGHRDPDEWNAMFHDFAHAFGRWNFYQTILDPYDRDTVAPGYGSLGDDFADIYADLRAGEFVDQTRSETFPNDVVWTWRDAFYTHWGRFHAARALYALSMLHTVHDGETAPADWGTWSDASAT